MLKAIARKILPARVRKSLNATLWHIEDWRKERTLRHLEKRSMHMQPGSIADCFGYRVRINDGPNFFTQYKDLFVRRLYHFEAATLEPHIIDCGSNIGMSILYFKHVYPDARILGFEPDPEIFPYLDENIIRNELTGVQLMQAAVAGQDGISEFLADGKCGSYLSNLRLPVIDPSLSKTEVRCVRLKDYLTEPIDLLKMNIEGAECEVLTDCAESLRIVKEMIIEYHHLPGLSRTLHKILELLHEIGFEYLINDFDSQTNPGVLPPFHLTPESRYFLLLYARRKD